MQEKKTDFVLSTWSQSVGSTSLAILDLISFHSVKC